MNYILLAYFLGLVFALRWIKTPGEILRRQVPTGRTSSAPRAHPSRKPTLALTAQLRTNGRFVITAAAFICLPTLLARSFAPPTHFITNAASPVRDARIAQLLEGERLSPPPPLPADIFAALEVERAFPFPEDISRDWRLLDADFRQRLLTTFTYLREHHGYDAVLIEAYRSPERQQRLAARGRHLTRANANMSYHQYGLAADVAFLRDGKIVVSEQDPWAMRGYALLGEIGEATGLTWGGRWSLKDYGHIELRRLSKLAKEQTRTPSP